jgi:hypothetical protein
MERTEILFTTAAKKPGISEGLGIPVLNGKTAVRVLHIISRGNHIVGDFKKFPVVAAIWAFQKICYFLGVHCHGIPDEVKKLIFACLPKQKTMVDSSSLFW